MATAPLEFFCADFCPFAHRLWIALEEKEVPYQYREVNYCASFLPSTQDFYSVSTTRTVPAVRLPDGTCLEDSLPLLFWVDAEYAGRGAALVPAAGEATYHVHRLLKRVGDWVSAYYRVLMAQADALDERRAAFTAVLDEAAAELGRAPGPYYLGEAYSLVDVAWYPFVERASQLLKHFDKYDLEAHPQWAVLRRWRDAVAARPAVAATLWQTRSEASFATQPLPEECGDRAAYLRGFYAMYAAADVAEGKKRLGALRPPRMPQEDWDAALAQAEAHK